MRVLNRVAHARLGDAHSAFAARFATPLWVSTLAGCVLRQYTCSGGVLSVLFVQGYSVALHYPSPIGLEDGAPPAAVRALLPTDTHEGTLRRCGTGWLLAVRACPLAFIDALEAAAAEGDARNTNSSARKS
jgi:hypothetical protein